MEQEAALKQEAAAFDSRAFRRALGNFVTGVTIATAIDAVGRPRGLTINSFTSVSLAPPLILICIANNAGSYEVFRQAKDFAVNILSEDQRNISDLFASKAEDKFDHVTWLSEPGDAPAILGSLATFQCHTEDCITAGDHIVLLGRVKRFETAARRPLVYAQGGYISISAQYAAVAGAPGHNVVVSCIAEKDGQILLTRGKDEKWALPNARLDVAAERLPSLVESLRRMGVKVEVTFLYSVFESPRKILNVVYRGTIDDIGTMTDAVSLRREAEIPWRDLYPSQLEGMLRRYFRERELDQFSVYADLATPGFVASVGKVPEAWDSYVSKLSKE